jgi:hypothetical protein
MGYAPYSQPDPWFNYRFTHPESYSDDDEERSPGASMFTWILRVAIFYGVYRITLWAIKTIKGADMYRVAVRAIEAVKAVDMYRVAARTIEAAKGVDMYQVVVQNTKVLNGVAKSAWIGYVGFPGIFGRIWASSKSICVKRHLVDYVSNSMYLR